MIVGVSAVIVLIVAAVVAVAINATDGGDDDVATDDVAADSDTTTTEGSADSTSTTETSTTELPESGLPGEEFTDPEGIYTMSIDPEWVPNHGSVMEAVEVWAVRPPTGRFADNVNVLTQRMGGDLSAYMDSALQGARASVDDLALVNRDIVEGASGQELGVMEYTGTQFDRPMHFLQVFLVSDAAAAVATLTTTPESFQDTRAAVEPYLLTLQFSDCPPATVIPCT